ncbi:hypothetical protein [Deinococcus pimensis]|uniref:hypothetical protein n=1 Tax=Deinococcus pimensis TaxID=309888 RepID=UPI000486C650|nr:hypothetical protein [Deinococcus pimensis]
MNIAFSALVLALLLLPGGLFRVGYLRGLFKRSPVGGFNLTDNLGWLVVGSLLTHTVAVSVLRAFSLNVRYDLILPILTGQFGKDAELLKAIIRNLPAQQGLYAAYFLLTSVGAYLLGILLHVLVRTTGADRRINLLSFGNDWYYTLSQRPNRFRVGPLFEVFGRGVGRRLAQVDVFASGIVEQKDGAYLYRGIVRDYHLDEKGGLERLELKNAHRRRLSDDREQGKPHSPFGDERYYKIVGDRFILRMGETKTLNVQYVNIVPVEEVEVDASAVVEETDVDRSITADPFDD